MTLAITGSTGRLGGRVARLLAATGVPLQLLVRDPSRAPVVANAQAVALGPAGYADHDAVLTALAGIDTLLMVSAAETPDRVDQHRTFVDAAAAAGVGHLVYISFFGASPTATFTLARDHWATEQHIRQSGMAFTFLRDNLYADFLPMMVGEDGVIRGPAGDGVLAAVAQDDIAAVAAAVLAASAVGDDVHAGQTYDLTGPEAFSLATAAQQLSEATGRRVSYHAESKEEAYTSRASYGAPAWQVDAWVSTYTAIAAGELAQVSDDVERITGRPAMSLATLLKQDGLPQSRT